MKKPRQKTNQRTVGRTLDRRRLDGHPQEIIGETDYPLSARSGLNSDS